tara:strand:- start:15443 stop:15778 length:336 start_codon:yes stop_codon:yes gene_type:complete
MSFNNELKARGALFVNARKEQDKHPDYRGDVEIKAEVLDDLIAQRSAGVQLPKMEIVGWKQTSPKAGAYLSIALNKQWIKPDGHNNPPAQTATPVPAAPPSPASDDVEIPF